MKFDAPFTPGTFQRGVIVASTVDADVAKAQQPYKGMPFEITIDRMEPERVFAFRWHPFAVERGVDTRLSRRLWSSLLSRTSRMAPCSQSPNRASMGSRWHRRAKAFTANDQGWTMVVSLIEKHLAHAG